MLELDFVIQSRLGSSRLPFKAALQLPEGIASVKGAVVRCEKIISKMGWNTKVYVACPVSEVEVYENLCSGTNAIIYGGDPNNVALRFLNLSDEYNIGSFIRITADNPYVCTDVVEYLSSISSSKSVCISLFHQKKLPNGTVMSLLSKTYLKALVNSTCQQAHEHLIISEDDDINLLIEKPVIPINLIWPKGRFCLDNEEDYLFFFKNPSIQTYFKVSQMKSHLTDRKNVKLY